MTRKNFYAVTDLDRVAHLRQDADWLAAQLGNAKNRVLPVWHSKNLIAAAETPTLASIAAPHAAVLADGAAEPVLLGVADDIAFFALDISHIETPEAHDVLAAAGAFEDLRAVGPVIEQSEGHLMAYARGMAYWHSRHAFCGTCGAPTRSDQAGHLRTCTDDSCGALQFPRTDSAIIVLVYHDDATVLARADRFPPGMKSVLAGFLEPGESLEDTVQREVYEEVGIHVTDVAYQSSQPWPFPASLMVGFRARALDTELRPDDEEVKEAQWHSRDELRALTPRSAVKLPRTDSIARRLLDDWLADD